MNQAVKDIIESYPKEVSLKLIHLRHLIIQSVERLNLLSSFEETIKWGQAAYKVKDGSTIRIAWQASKPNEYGMYFICSTNLIETFRDLYISDFTFEGNRAIIFSMDEKIQEEALKHCIEMALTYHKIKHLPNLGN